MVVLPNFKISKQTALQQLANSDYEFVHLLKHADIDVEFYKPDKIDKQQPHKRDEIYVVASGAAKFYYEGEIADVSACDLLFVAAHKEHRFYNFTADFTVWVIFFGKEDE